MTRRDCTTCVHEHFPEDAIPCRACIIAWEAGSAWTGYEPAAPQPAQPAQPADHVADASKMVPLDMHFRFTAGPAPWTNTRVPAQVWHTARAVYGTSTLEDEQRVYRTVQATLHALATPKFERTHCSQCGGEFGPGNAGFSHCADHAQPAAQAVAPDNKADRVHAIVNAGPFPGMSEAFDAHMGAAVWTDPAYAPDASTWAAAWKAALAAAPAVAPPAVQPLTPLTDEQLDALRGQLAARMESTGAVIGADHWDHSFADLAVAEFCRINGLTLGGIGDSKGGDKE